MAFYESRFQSKCFLKRLKHFVPSANFSLMFLSLADGFFGLFVAVSKFSIKKSLSQALNVVMQWLHPRPPNALEWPASRSTASSSRK